MPSYFWDNYSMVLTEQRRATTATFDFYNTSGGFNLEAFDSTIANVSASKVMVLLNFPNNPTGYTPTVDEAAGIVSILKKHADAGKKILAVIDDAYFGLVYEEGVCRESLFAFLADAHENILAVKGDAATKELMVWGFRTGFITYGGKGLTAEQYTALVQKTGGAIRGTVSCSPTSAQVFLRRALENPATAAQRAENVRVLHERYVAMKKAIAGQKVSTVLTPLPFNSGYFMSFQFAGDTDVLRRHLLDTYGIGTISLQGSLLRLAFSSVDVDKIPLLVETVYRAAAEVAVLSLLTNRRKNGSVSLVFPGL